MLLNRLGELRERACLDSVKEPFKETKIDNTFEQVSSHSLALTLRNLGEFGQVIIAENGARVLCTKVRRNVGAVHDFTEKLRWVTVPDVRTRLQQQALLKECECSKLIPAALAAIEHFEKDPSQAIEAEGLSRLRKSLAARLRGRVDESMREFFASRAARNQEEQTLIRRIVGYAFPHAAEADVQRAMNYPDLFSTILEKRLEATVNKKLSLCDVLDQIMENHSSLRRRLENDSLELQLLFFQFNMVTDKSDTLLAALEDDLSQTIADTALALEDLKMARALKQSNARTRLCFGMILLCIVLILCKRYVKILKPEARTPTHVIEHTEVVPPHGAYATQPPAAPSMAQVQGGNVSVPMQDFLHLWSQDASAILSTKTAEVEVQHHLRQGGGLWERITNLRNGFRKKRRPCPEAWLAPRVQETD